jgi:type IV pilus assembly protein PilA
MSRTDGFSLIELLIVVAVIGIIAALAVPNLIQSKKAANEASAIASVRNLITAEITYASTVGNGNFGSLGELSGENFVDELLGSGQKDGYLFDLSANAALGFSIVANPAAPGTTGERAFYGDETGVIRFTTDGTVPDSASPALGSGSTP